MKSIAGIWRFRRINTLKKLLITGASERSFIGKVLKAELADEYEIYAPGRETLDLTDGDAVARWLSKHPVDVIIHAAVHVPMWHGVDKEAENDLRMFFNLEKCRDDYGHLIYFGSGAEYDKRFPIDNVREEELGRTIPDSSYGFAKYVANQYTRQNRHITNLRLFGIFGPQENWRVKLITGLCYKALFGLPLTVRGHCMFDFMYIDDLIPIVRAAIEGKLKQRDYNVCTGVSVDIADIAEVVQKLSPKPVELKLLSDNWANAYTGNCDRLQAELSVSFTPMEDAVKKLLAYFEAVKNPDDLETLRGIR